MIEQQGEQAFFFFFPFSPSNWASCKQASMPLQMDVPSIYSTVHESGLLLGLLFTCARRRASMASSRTSTRPTSVVLPEAAALPRSLMPCGCSFASKPGMHSSRARTRAKIGTDSLASAPLPCTTHGMSWLEGSCTTQLQSRGRNVRLGHHKAHLGQRPGALPGEVAAGGGLQLLAGAAPHVVRRAGEGRVAGEGCVGLGRVEGVILCICCEGICTPAIS